MFSVAILSIKQAFILPSFRFDRNSRMDCFELQENRNEDILHFKKRYSSNIKRPRKRNTQYNHFINRALTKHIVSASSKYNMLS